MISGNGAVFNQMTFLFCFQVTITMAADFSNERHLGRPPTCCHSYTSTELDRGKYLTRQCKRTAQNS